MEDIEMDDAYTLPLSEDDNDICISILARFSNSTRDDHHHLCAAISELKDKNLPSTPVAYLGFTCSSLDGLSSQPEPSAHVIDALLTILSIVFQKVSAAILMNKSEFLSELLVRVLRSSSLTVGVAVSGLTCISHLLIIRGRVNWSDVSSLYGLLLSFITDSRPKVRRQSHLCLRDVLQSFQGTPLLAPASEAVTNLFERFLLLAGGSNADAGEGPKGAQEVLYVLDALKECLFLMSINYKTAILKYYKTLLELHQPLVTKRITDSLNILCLNPTTDVSPEVLLDLLCSLALSVSTNKTSADGMTFTARLLGTGMAKVYSLNRQICVVKLPTVFNALRDVLASKHEEAIHAGTDKFKSLIHVCIDESLIKQGVDQIVMNANMDTRKSGRTIIEVCASIESLLRYDYNGVWDLAFHIVSAMFDKLGVYSSYFMRGALKSLADMENLPDEDFPFRKQLHECLGSALVAMGPETFLGLIPLNLEAENLSQANVWLFPILTQYTIGARLSFFTESILGMVRTIKEKSRKLESQGRTFSSRSTDALVHALWSLLPSFCNYASDTAESFKDLEQALCSALENEPEIRGIICSSLQILVQQNKKTVEEVNDLDDSEVGSARHRALANYTPQVTADNLSVLKSSACKLLDVLSDVFSNSTKDDAGCLQSTIGEFASISDKEAVSWFFRNTMGKLLEVTVEVTKAKDSRDSNCKRFLSSKLDELLDLIEVLPSCHFSAKQHRLDCLYLLVVHLSKSGTEQRLHVILSFLAEIILALTEAHNKTRNRAYDILVQIGHAYGDEEKGGKREDLCKFFCMVAGGLAGKTPHMISAAMKGSARLAYEFSDLVSTATNLLPFTFLLLQRRNKEIIKATLGFWKVLVAKSQTEGLQLHLERMVESLLKLQDATKTHFKAKVKFLLEMLVRKCGLDAVKAVMPEKHMKLLTNIRKIKERKEWKLGSKSEEARSQVSKATTSRLSRWNHTKIFSDFDHEETEDSDTDYMDAKTVSGKRRKASLQLKSKASSLRRRTNKNLLDQLEDEPLDLLDRQRTRSALLSSENLKRKMESDDEPEIDDDGRLIICDEAESYKKKPSKPHSDARSEAGGSYLP
ncbi:RRP12-like protein [Prunus yedoensis var. nudiflora]|uniref:RRP12-like protein n=1 Tax=Prunus yedoensis var. nudiflora TaxID=2094558 RepID=A0A314Z210_PRUYE|nr:RRP12-like protein [Prunus yedoensis var. nudiflora]